MFRLFMLVSFICFISFKGYSKSFEIDTIYNTEENWISGQYADLPKWIYSETENNLVIAVSDPCMKPMKGREQAILRALFIYSLRINASLKYMHEYFSISNEFKNGILQHKNKITSLLKLTPQKGRFYCKIEKEHISLFNETFLLVRIIPEKDLQNNDANYTLYNYESQNECMFSFVEDNYEGKELYIDTQINSDKSNLKFIMKGKTDYPRIISSMDGADLFITGKGCWYNSTLDNFDYKINHANMINSFWNAYVVSLAEFLFSYQYKSSNVKYTGESYSNDENYNADKLEEISQTSASLNIKIFPHIKGIYNNKLFVDWELIQTK